MGNLVAQGCRRSRRAASNGVGANETAGAHRRAVIRRGVTTGKRQKWENAMGGHQEELFFRRIGSCDPNHLLPQPMKGLTSMKQPCLTCGALSVGNRCPRCSEAHKKVKPVTVAEPKRRYSHARGYDWQWRKLSEQARKLQPFCSDCGTTEDLTADHSIRAWTRRAAGKPIRLQDIDVLCRKCNTKRGAARGDKVKRHA